MIREAKDLKVEIKENMMGGKGQIKITHFYEPEEFFGKGRLFGITEIEPGNSLGVHEHVGEQEAYYILSGRALYNDNGTEVEIGPGTLTICPPGEKHGIEAIGDETLVYGMLILFTE